MEEVRPLRGTEERLEGRTACVVRRWMRDVLPAGEGWWVRGGEMSSMMLIGVGGFFAGGGGGGMCGAS